MTLFVKLKQRIQVLRLQWEGPFIYRSGVNLMGLTEYNKAMIKALCKCDIREARGWAELSLG